MLSDVFLRLRALFRRTAVDREIDDELRFHLEKQIESYQAAGLRLDEARRRAHLEFGGLDQVKEDYRDALGVRIADNLSRDLRLAWRSLRATPVVSAVAILSLALGIGANTAIFSIVNSLLLRALPVAQPEQLAILRGQAAWTNPIWEELRGRSDLFAGALAWGLRSFNIAEGGEAQMADVMLASGRYFDVLRIRPIVGRAMTVDDDRRGGGADGAVAVIGHSFWQRHFGGAADVVGRQVTINRVAFTVIGVAPPGFRGLDVGRTFDLIIPIGTEPLIHGADTWLDNRLTWWLNIIVRIEPPQTIDGVQAALAGVTDQVRTATLPPGRSIDEYLEGPFTLEPAATGRSTLRSRYQRPLFTMLIVVALVLVIACANIANLLLARATARRHELSVRRALGATQWRLAQQLLFESFMLASMGAGLGFLFAWWAAPAIVAQLSTPAVSVFLDLAPDWRVLGFTAALTVLTALVFGTVPALRASRAAPMVSIKEGGRMLTADGQQSVASGLVIVQVGLSLVLVVVAALFVRTFVSLATRPLGFETERILLASISAPQARFAETDLRPMFERVRNAASGIPGVAEAGLSLMKPVTGGGGWGDSRLTVEGAAPPPPNQRQTWLNAVTPRWLAALGIPLLAGRDFNDDDREGAPLVAIVNEAFARRFGVGPNPVGRTVLMKQSRGTPQGEVETDVRVDIVGLAADAVYMRPRDPIPPTMYVPLGQEGDTYPFVELSIRAAAGPPLLLAKNAAAAIATVNPDLVLSFQPLDDQVSATLIQERLLATLSGFFGATALLLAGLGLYGVTSYAVSRRRNEIGIRMALGAAPAGVIRLVLARVLTLVMAGGLLGVLGSVWASRFVATLLYGLEPHDPPTLIGAAALLAAVAAVAGYLPARRAARIDPAAVLRE